MDWDWEDGPPSDTSRPRRAADERRPAAEPGPAEPERPEPERPEPERPEPERPEPLDESVTQVFSADMAWEQSGEPGPHESAPHSPPLEYVLPDRTETGRSPAQSDPEFAYLPPAAAAGGPESGRRLRSTEDRAARRELRRRQLRRRRLIALAVVVAIVVLLVFLLVRGCGGSDAPAAALGMIVVDMRLSVVPERQ